MTSAFGRTVSRLDFAHTRLAFSPKVGRGADRTTHTVVVKLEPKKLEKPVVSRLHRKAAHHQLEFVPDQISLQVLPAASGPLPALESLYHSTVSFTC